MRLAVPFEGRVRYNWAVPYDFPQLLLVEKWVLIASLMLFIIGYRLGVASFLSALVLSHLATIRYIVNVSGGTTSLFFSSLILLLFGLYREQDYLSVDAFRRTREKSIQYLRNHLMDARKRPHSMSALKWGLLVLAIVYFGAGFDKLTTSGLGWTDPSNLSRIILIRNIYYDLPVELGTILLDYPLLISAAAWGTLVLEIGLLISVLLGFPISLFILSLFGMQLTIALVLGPFFFDIFPMFAMFFAWDSVYRRFTPDESLDIVFDEFCHFLDRCLYAVKFLDVHGSVTFYPQSDAPISGANRSKVKFDQSIYAFRGEDVYEGYEAIRELFNQFPITIPVAWMMRYQLIETIGKLIYQYIADENFQYFGSYVG